MVDNLVPLLDGKKVGLFTQIVYHKHLYYTLDSTMQITFEKELVETVLWLLKQIGNDHEVDCSPIESRHVVSRFYAKSSLEVSECKQMKILLMIHVTLSAGVQRKGSSSQQATFCG